MARTVSTVDELVTAARNTGTDQIVVSGKITGIPTLRLGPGQRLTGDSGATLAFVDGVDGVRLSRDNELADLRIEVTPACRAVFNDTSVAELGTLSMRGITAVGQVQILAQDQVGSGHVVVDGLDVVAADLRDRDGRPGLLGVGVVQGAFTLWNRQPADAVLTARIRAVSAGREAAPVRGSGVFLSGATGDGPPGLEVEVLQTGPVYTDAGIAAGSSDTISAGVFVGYGVHVRQVHNLDPVTTYGVNDMVLDNWGVVDDWRASGTLSSHGPTGVGFVNFGEIGELRVEAPVVTRGVGARGFNVYRLDGYTGPTVRTVEFHSVTTHADAAIGIQIGQPIGRLVVHHGIQTHGGTGDSLVRGVITRLSAHAVSVLPGGRVTSVEVGGAVSSAGAGVAAVDIRGEVEAMRIAGGVHARGDGADALRVEAGAVGLRDTTVNARDGAAVRLTSGSAIELRGVAARGAHGDVVVAR